jgi:hypothetical protein
MNEAYYEIIIIIQAYGTSTTKDQLISAPPAKQNTAAIDYWNQTKVGYSANNPLRSENKPQSIFKQTS